MSFFEKKIDLNVSALGGQRRNERNVFPTSVRLLVLSRTGNEDKGGNRETSHWASRSQSWSVGRGGGSVSLLRLGPDSSGRHGH